MEIFRLRSFISGTLKKQIWEWYGSWKEFQFQTKEWFWGLGFYNLRTSNFSYLDSDKAVLCLSPNLSLTDLRNLVLRGMFFLFPCPMFALNSIRLRYDKHPWQKHQTVPPASRRQSIVSQHCFSESYMKVNSMKIKGFKC